MSQYKIYCASNLLLVDELKSPIAAETLFVILERLYRLQNLIQKNLYDRENLAWLHDKRECRQI
jgi:hypothetical protein